MNTLVSKEPEHFPPSIVEFYNNYLKLPSRGMQLLPMQQCILHSFYINSIGNEENKDYPILPPGGVECKGMDWNSKDVFDSLVLALGRRTGKNFILSIIANYEFFKLIYLEPYNKMNATILCISPSSEISKTLFTEIKEMFLHSSIYPSLTDTLKFTHNSIKYTDAYQRTVEIRCESANSTALFGTAAHTLILNEVSVMKNAGYLYRMLYPTTKSYNDKRNIGKAIIVGTPRPITADNLLYHAYTYEMARKLSFRSSTWAANLTHTEETLRKEEFTLSDEAFAMEYGAEFIADDPTEQVTFRLRQSLIEKLKKQARKLSYKKDRDVVYTDILRTILEETIDKYIDTEV